MRFRRVGRVYLLSTTIALAALNTHSQRIVLAQKGYHAFVGHQATSAFEPR